MFSIMRLPRRSSAIAILAIALAGCKSGPLTTAKQVSVDVPTGWTKIDHPAQGISMATPGEWLEYGTKPKEAPGAAADDPSAKIAAMMGQIGQDDPETVKETIKKREDKGIFVYCLNQAVRPISGEERTHFRVEMHEVGGNAQMSDVDDWMKSDLNGKGSMSTVDLPIGKAAKGVGKNTRADGGEITTVDYGLVSGNKEYFISFITEEASNQLEQSADQIMQTFRVK